MVSFLVRVATLGAVVLAMAGPASSAGSQTAPLNDLDGAGLIDLLDAELDENFLTNGFRNLQQFEMTSSPTPSPTAGSRELETAPPSSVGEFVTSSPTAVLGETAAPTMMGSTAAPTMMTIETPAPMPISETVPPTTSGTASWRPASATTLALAAVATAAVLA